MSDSELLKRITVRPDVFGGKPIVRDMRISVELILSLLAQGTTPEEILDDYPRLEADDIRACIAYAHAAIADDTLAAVSVARRVKFLVVKPSCGFRARRDARASGHDHDVRHD